MLAIVLVLMLLLDLSGRSLSFSAGGSTVGQCHAPSHTQPVPATSFEPVWRTFTDVPDRFSLSLPATWDGMRVGDPIPTGSPWLGDSLQRMVAASSGATRFVAAGRPGAPNLYVRTQPAGLGATLDCTLTVSSDVPGRVGAARNVRAARVHLLAGEANEEVFTIRNTSLSGDLRDYTNYRFALLQGSPRTWLMLLFTAPSDEANRDEPVFWQIAESLRLQPATRPDTDACLITAPTRPDVLSPAGRACTVPVGALYFRFDCAASLFTPSSVQGSGFEYDLASRKFVSATGLTPGKGACGITVPAGKGYAIELAHAGLADAIVAVDFVATSNAYASASLAARRSAEDEVFTNYETTTGSITVWQRQAGHDLHVASALAGTASGAVHRLVLSVRGGQESTWLDDQPVGRGDAVAVTQSGGISAYFANRDATTTATFDLLRLVVYQPPS
jgi:hypothetical protein